MDAFIIIFLFIIVIVCTIGLAVFNMYRNKLQTSKNYERSLKMVSLYIQLPPSTEDTKEEGRDKREVTEEAISEAQVMYNIISSTATKGFKSRIYGQRHMSFEIIAKDGLIYYYAVAPYILVSTIKQAIIAAYPSARLEETDEKNIFSKVGKINGTVGGEFSLKNSFIYPINTYKESKNDASRAILNALSESGSDDGVAIQILFRPADPSWTKVSLEEASKIRNNPNGKKTNLKNILFALWKTPSNAEQKNNTTELSSTTQEKLAAIEEKTRYPGYETLIRVVVSSNVVMRAQSLMRNVIAAFALFDSPSNNGFKFSMSQDIDKLVNDYIFRFFPQKNNQNILNSVELATIFHLPEQSSIATSQVKRQSVKQVDGPSEVVNDGFLLGYNEFKGIKKPIRLGTNDRRRHAYIIGQTGTGKSVLLENLAYQDMLAGRGFAFVDPHGDAVESLVGKVPKERVDDIIYFNPGDMAHPIGLNMFEYHSNDEKDFLIQECISMLYGLYDPGHTGIVGPRLEHIFRNSALLLMSDPNGGTFIDIPKLLVDENFRNKKLKYVKDQTVLDYWTKEFPASQRSNEAGEVISWVVAKFGPFVSNDAMRNIIGQTKSGFNIRDIMDNHKILLVNLSKGLMGEFNSKLLGIVFVMKFQAAAMSRANIPEDQRADFSLYVDEFQNFATDSFETILSEARKYRLNLILGNQFMTQLTDKIREAIIGNVGTIISGRIGITDAEVLSKKFSPTFTAEDLTKLPNYQSIASVMIDNVPSAPFSMSFIPPMGKSNQKLSDAIKKLSAIKYARPRSEVENEIFGRLNGSSPARSDNGSITQAAKTSSSFVNEWLNKRKQLQNQDDKSSSYANTPQLLNQNINNNNINDKKIDNTENINQKILDIKKDHPGNDGVVINLH